MIRLESVCFTYPDGTEGLKEVTLSIPEGALFLVCGQNGSGKSTLLRVIAGLYVPTKGTVVIDGKVLHKDLKDVRGLVGLVFQNPNHQILVETVEEEIALGLFYLGLPRDEIEKRVREAMKMCKLEELSGKNCYFLSGGEKKKVVIASVLALKPKIILLDEPFSGLDFPATKAILKQIIEMKRAGYTLVVSSHEIEKIVPYVDIISVMHEGRVEVVSEKPEKVFPLLSRYGVSPPCYYLLGKEPIQWLST